MHAALLYIYIYIYLYSFIISLSTQNTFSAAGKKNRVLLSWSTIASSETSVKVQGTLTGSKTMH